jgi:hypothetical protein
MPGYTKAELARKKLNPAQYRWCRRCRSYWHRRVRHVRRAASKRARGRAARRRAKPLTEADKRFIDFLVEKAIQHLLVQAEP